MKGTFITAKGRELLAKALSGKTLLFTKIVVGNGIWEEEELKYARDLKSPVKEVPISSITNNKDGTVKITFVITNTDLRTGFFIREMGLYAKDPDTNEEVLYSISYSEHPDFIPPETIQRVEYIVHFYTVVETVEPEKVVAVIDDTIAIATREDIKKHNADTLSHPDIRELIRKFENEIVSIKAGNIDFSKVPDNTINWTALKEVPLSATPRANSIPVSDASGKIDRNWIDLPLVLGGTSYAVMTAGTSRPATPSSGHLFYNTSTNTLERYNGSGWETINWQEIVKASPEWIAGRLRVQSNVLQISPDGTNWYSCIPAVGVPVIEIRTLDNTSYSNKYFILPGTHVILRNANHIPVVYSQQAQFSITGLLTIGGATFGIKPSNINISDGRFQGYSADGTNWSSSGRSSVEILDTGSSPCQVAIDLHIHSSMYHTLALSKAISESGFNVGMFVGQGTIPSTSHWIGTLRAVDNSDSLVTAHYLVVSRKL